MRSRTQYFCPAFIWRFFIWRWLLSRLLTRELLKWLHNMRKHEKSTNTYLAHNLFLKLLEMPWIDCCRTKILENFTGCDNFCNFAGSLLWIHVKIFLNMFLNFGWISFQASLIGCFFKERMVNKQERVL